MARLGALLALFIVFIIPTWIVFHFLVGRARKRMGKRSFMQTQSLLKNVEYEFSNLETRLQSVESFVTSDDYALSKRRSQS